MEILLPPKKGEVENVKLNFEQLVVVGAMVREKHVSEVG